jgi:hypothetical protein
MIPPPLLRRLRVTAVALVIVVLLMGSRLAVARAPSSAAAEQHPAATIPFSDVHPYGANFFLEHEVESWKQTKTVEMAAEAGLHWAKQHFPWAEIEPRPGKYNFAKYDRLVDLYRSHGLEVIARLDWPPEWVKPASWVPEALRGHINAPPANNANYAAFVAETVRHFRGRVRFFQIWNEPNLLAEWGANPAHPVDPVEYAALLKAAAAAARSADANAVVLSAPLAINLEMTTLAGNLNDLDYLAGLYRAGAAPDFDVLSSNAFGMDRPPSDSPSPDVLNFRRAELQRAVMERNGDAETPMWFNEYGWNAAPLRVTSAWRNVTDEQQATWTVDGVRWAASHWPWAGVFSIWYFRQWGAKTPDAADYFFRMVDVEFTPRRLFFAVKDAAAQVSEAGPGVWAERSAPVTLPALDDWVWQRADGADDGNALSAHNPAGAKLMFHFHGNSVAARVRAGPDAGAVRVTVDGQDRRGTGLGGTVAFGSSTPGWAWVPLVGGLGDGSHELTLDTTGDGEVVIDGFQVAAIGSGERADGWLWGLGALAVLLAGLVGLDVVRVAGRIRV